MYYLAYILDIVILINFYAFGFHYNNIRKHISFSLHGTSSGNNQDNNKNHKNTDLPKRVTSNTNIPVRQQIAWAKAYKRFVEVSQKSSSYNNKQTQRFRKEKGIKEVNNSNDTDLVSYVDTKPPAIFIDGYNIIGFMRTVEGSTIIDFEESRDSLISDLAVLKSSTGWWIEVVFDAYKRGNSNQVKSMRSDTLKSIDGVIVTYTTRSETADNYIERRFSELARDGFTNMLVATDDYLLRQLAGSIGMGYLSASMLSEELRIAYYNWEQLQAEMYKDSVVKRSEVKSIQISNNNNDQDNLMRAMNQLRQDEKEKYQTMRNDNNNTNNNNYGVSALKLTQQKQNNNNNNNNNKLNNIQTVTTNSTTTISSSNQTNKTKKEKQKKYSSDSNVSFGDLRKTTMADGLSDELKRIMDKLQ